MTKINRFAVLFLLAAVAGCGQSPWNNPYPEEEATANVRYKSFEERPNHLDPAVAYSSNEYELIAQIYEPVLQYHYLKRPYTLIPQTSVALPVVTYLDARGAPLPASAREEEIAFSVYEIEIQPGIHYQPHPSFVSDAAGEYLYHQLSAEQMRDVFVLADFAQTASRELTAEDYVYQIKRLAHPKLHSPILGLMVNYIDGLGEYTKSLQQAVEAAPGWLDLRAHPLAGVEVVDRYRYRIRIKGKYPQFSYWLAMPFFAPLPWEADRFYAQPGLVAKNITLDWYPVGTGPYMLAINNPNRQMVMLRNPNFHGENYPSEGAPGDAAAGLLADAGKPMPFIDKVVFSLEKEDIPYWNKFLQGYYDASGVTSDSFDQAIRFDTQGEAGLSEIMREKGIELSTAVGTSIFYMGFNMLDPVVGGDSERARLLRQAISIAVDYEEFVSIFANGRGISAQGPLPPGIFGYVEGEAGINRYVYAWDKGVARRKSMDEAKRLLAQAGYPEGRDAATGKPLAINFDVTATGPESAAWLNWYRKQFDKLGIQLVVRNTDYNRFQDKMRTGNAQLFRWGWNADYPDPENFLFLLYGPNGKVKHQGENAANYDNPEFNRRFERMKNMDNGPQRQALIDEMIEIARRDAPWIWGMHPLSFGLYHGWLKNFSPNMMANNTAKYLRIDPAQRAQKRAAWNRPVVWPLVLIALALLAVIVPAFIAYRRRERRVES